MTIVCLLSSRGSVVPMSDAACVSVGRPRSWVEFGKNVAFNDACQNGRRRMAENLRLSSWLFRNMPVICVVNTARNLIFERCVLPTSYSRVQTTGIFDKHLSLEDICELWERRTCIGINQSCLSVNVTQVKGIASFV